ncbi:hypothetical protein D9M68_851290 [compost metagenome]
MPTSSTTIDRAMLKVNSTSSRNGGIGSMTMPSMTSSIKGMPRLPSRNPDRLLRTLPTICERSTATSLPQPIQSFDANRAFAKGSARSCPTLPGLGISPRARIARWVSLRSTLRGPPHPTNCPSLTLQIAT